MQGRHQINFDDPAQQAVVNRVGLAWRELRRGGASAVLRDHLFRSLSGTLEPGQVDTLELIVQRDRWRMSELADALRVDPSTATRAVQRMVALGFAERRACSDDGRVVMVSATQSGRDWYAQLVTNRQTMMQRLLGSFDDHERAEFADLLERFVGEIDAFVAELDD